MERAEEPDHSRPNLDDLREAAVGVVRKLVEAAREKGAVPVLYQTWGYRGGDTRLAEFRMTPGADTADAASERLLLAIDQPFANHNGGALAFGRDGLLYVALGDGGSGGDPQGHGQPAPLRSPPPERLTMRLDH